MKKVWLSAPEISDLEKNAVMKALDGNEISLGSGLQDFRKKLEHYLSSNAALLSSGTAALHLALKVLNIKEGDEVLCSTFTFAATANPIKYCGAQPVFIDSEEKGWNLCPELLEKAIIDRRSKGYFPRAVIAVDLYGMPCDYSAVSEICKKYELYLIEDAAEALGSTYKEKPAGSFGDIGVLSFNANKIITTGGGGALISSEKTFTELASHLASQARDKAEYYLHSHIGFNYRMNNLGAAIGSVQFDKLKDRVRAKRKLFNRYLENIPELGSGQIESGDSQSNRWLSAFAIQKGKASWSILQEELRKKNIETRPLWKPLHTQPIFQGCPKYINGVSEDLFSRGICLPSNAHLSEDDQDLICSSIKDFFAKYS